MDKNQQSSGKKKTAEKNMKIGYWIGLIIGVIIAQILKLGFIGWVALGILGSIIIGSLIGVLLTMKR